MEPLPTLLRPYFWDHNFRKLDWERDRELVVRRILSDGSWPAVQWLRSRLGDDALRDWLRERRGARLSPRQLRLWELVLDLPHREVSGWLIMRHPDVWERRR